MIDGIPHAMSPAPRPEHQAIAGNLHAEFRAALRRSTCSCKVYQPIDYKIEEETVVQPDLLIVCKPVTKAFLDFAPELVAEILSPATALKDRHTKFEIYQEQKIRFYLIVDIEQRMVDVYQLSGEGLYQKVLLEMDKPFKLEVPNCRFNLTFENIWT